jgi:hypothetical protein
MPVVPVGRDDVVVLAHQGAAADGHRLLADVEVKEPADLLRLVGPQAALLEPADPHHQAVEADLLLNRQGGVDRGTREVRVAGTWFASCFGGGAGFLAHDEWKGSVSGLTAWKSSVVFSGGRRRDLLDLDPNGPSGAAVGLQGDEPARGAGRRWARAPRGRSPGSAARRRLFRLKNPKRPSDMSGGRPGRGLRHLKRNMSQCDWPS